MMKLLISMMLSLLGGALLFSCGDIFNEDEYDVKSVEASPTMALPLAFGELSIQDILSKQDSAFIKVDAQGLVYLQYDQTLKTQAVRDLITIPDKNNVNASLAVPAGTIPPTNSDISSTTQSKTVTLDMTEKLTEILFKAGGLQYNVSLAPPNTNYRYAMRIAIPEFTDAKSGVVFSREVTGSGVLDLTGQLFKGTTPNQITINYTLINKQNPNAVVIAPGSSVDVSLSFRGMNYTYLKGFFGDQSADVPLETITIGAFGSALIGTNNVSFAQPLVRFEVTNDAGVPTKIYFSALEARKKGYPPIPLELSPASPLTLNSPTIMGQSALTNAQITNSKQVLDYTPDEFVYHLNVHINEGLTSGTNFITDTSSTQVRMIVNVPLYGHASDIVLADTLEIDLSDADESDIESGALRVKTSNEIPLQANMQIFLANKDYVVQDVLFTTPEQMAVIKSSVVNASGEFQSAGNVDNLIPLDKTKLQKIFSAKYLIIQSRMSTTRDSNGTFPDVKFKASYKMDIKLGLQVKLKIHSDLNDL